MPATLLYRDNNGLRDDHLVWSNPAAAYVRSILFEGLARNTLGASDTISAGNWAVVTNGAIAGPDGTMTGIKLAEDTTAGIYHHGQQNLYNQAAGAPQAMDFAAKAGTRGILWINALGSNPGTPAKVNLSAGTIINQGTGFTVRLTPLVLGWYLIDVTWNDTGTGYFAVGLCDDSGAASYDGAGSGKYLYLWRFTFYANRANSGSPIYSNGAQAGCNPDSTHPYYQTGPAPDFLYGTGRFPDSSLSLPFAPVPQAMSGLFRFVELGTRATTGAGLMSVGNAQQTSARLQLRRGSTGYELAHHNGSAERVSTLPGYPAQGQLVDLRWVLYADGSVRLYQSLDAGAETSGAQSSALALAGGWAESVRWVGGLGADPSTVGFMAYIGAVELSGTAATLADLVAALALDPPVITSAATSSDGTAGSAFAFAVVASGAASFGATGLPAGLAINASTGVISGTPLYAGTSTITLSATNAAGTGTQVFTLTLQKPAMPNYYRDVNFERLTGEAFFLPDGQVGQINLGNIEMHKLTVGAKNATAKRARKGIVSIGASATTEVEPEWEFTINEKFRGNAELILGGQRLADTNQAAATTLSANIASAQPLQSYSLGKFGVVNVVVKKGGTALTLDVDYQLDAEKGKVTIMSGGAVAANDALTVEFDATLQKLDNFSVLTKLDRRGVIELYEEDTVSQMWRNLWVIPVTLSPAELGDRDPGKFLSNKLKATVTGMMVQRSRQD